MATRSWIIPTPRAMDLEQVTSLRLELMAGAAEVLSHDHDHVHLIVDDVSGPSLEVSWDDGAAAITHGASGLGGMWRRLLPSNASGRVRLRVFVPRTVALSVAAGASEVLVQGLDEDVELTSTSGRVTALDCTAALRAVTRSGDVVVRRHAGDLAVTSASGRTDIEGKMPRLELSTGTSAVWVTNLAQDSRTTIASMTGAVDVRVRPQVQVRVKATRLGGHARVNGQEADLRGGRVHIEGEDGGGVAEINVSMATGSLHVRTDANQ